MPRTIAITGAAGFIGSHLTERLLQAGDTVVALIQPGSSTHRIERWRNHSQFVPFATDAVGMRSAFVSHRVDCVVHLAALYKKTHTSAEEAAALIDSNVTFPTLLFDIMREQQVKRCITTGTFFEYDTSGSAPLTENSPLRPYNLYAATKEACAVIARQYVTQEQFSVMHLRLFAPYGPLDNEKLISYLIRNCRSGDPIELTAGEQAWSYTYVGDIVDAYERAIDYVIAASAGYTVLNIGRSETTTVRQIAETVHLLTQSTAPLSFTKPYPPHEIFMAKCDATKAKELLGWEARTSIEDGLRATLASFSA